MVVALVGVAALGTFVLYEHYGLSDRARAVIAVRTERFGGTTKARVGTWLAAHHPAAKVDWAAVSVGPFTDEVDVTLTVEGVGAWRFRVEVGSRRVTPRDPSTVQLIDQIKSWASE